MKNLSILLLFVGHALAHGESFKEGNSIVIPIEKCPESHFCQNAPHQEELTEEQQKMLDEMAEERANETQNGGWTIHKNEQNYGEGHQPLWLSEKEEFDRVPIAGENLLGWKFDATWDGNQQEVECNEPIKIVQVVHKFDRFRRWSLTNPPDVSLIILNIMLDADGKVDGPKAVDDPQYGGSMTRRNGSISFVDTPGMSFELLDLFGYLDVMIETCALCQDPFAVISCVTWGFYMTLSEDREIDISARGDLEFGSGSSRFVDIVQDFLDVSR